MHADGQYQARTFQRRFLDFLACTARPDPNFFLPGDVSHWMDLVTVNLRERSASSDFLKLLIKQSNHFNSMFGKCRGQVEYVWLAKHLGLKVMEPVNYVTTRFSSLSFEQWDKIYSSYQALIVAFIDASRTGRNLPMKTSKTAVFKV